MDREELKEMRPLISSALTDKSKSIEVFQNEVLRPVIKMQHEIILAYIGSLEQFKNILSQKGSRLDFQTRVHTFISRQLDIKNQLIGMVLGMLTEEEFVFYRDHQNDLHKRISQMISQRVSDTLY
jgi:hypothetical protein